MRWTTRPSLVLAVIFVAFAAANVSAQQAPPDLKSLAGKWTGYASPTRGSNIPLQVELKPDGSYTSQWGPTIGKGTIKAEGNKLVAEGQMISGTTTASAGTGKSELTLTNKDGKQIMTGVGRDADGPFNFQLTKQ